MWLKWRPNTLLRFFMCLLTKKNKKTKPKQIITVKDNDSSTCLHFALPKAKLCIYRRPEAQLHETLLWTTESFFARALVQEWFCRTSFFTTSFMNFKFISCQENTQHLKRGSDDCDNLLALKLILKVNELHGRLIQKVHPWCTAQWVSNFLIWAYAWYWSVL